MSNGSQFNQIRIDAGHKKRLQRITNTRTCTRKSNVHPYHGSLVFSPALFHVLNVLGRGPRQLQRTPHCARRRCAAQPLSDSVRRIRPFATSTFASSLPPTFSVLTLLATIICELGERALRSTASSPTTASSDLIYIRVVACVWRVIPGLTVVAAADRVDSLLADPVATIPLFRLQRAHQRHN